MPPPTPPAPPPPKPLPSYKKGKQTKVMRAFRSVFRSFPIFTCKISLHPGGHLQQDNHHKATNHVTGTLYGYRKGRVTLALQETPKSLPLMVLGSELQTNVLQKEMTEATVKIALECEKQSGKEKEKEKVKLLREPLWTMFLNGKKVGAGVRRETTDEDMKVIRSLWPVSTGVGVLPGKSEVEGEDGEIAYTRAHFDRVVGSKDLETLYMMSPDGNNGPELSIFFLRI